MVASAQDGDGLSSAEPSVPETSRPCIGPEKQEGEVAVLNYGNLPGASPQAVSFHISSPPRQELLHFVTFQKSRCDLKSMEGFKMVCLERCSRMTVKSKAVESHWALPFPSHVALGKLQPLCRPQWLICKLRPFIMALSE